MADRTRKHYQALYRELVRVQGPLDKVRLSLFSQSEIDGERYGIYQVVPL